MRSVEFWKPFIISIIVMPLAFLFAYISAGFGHGTYWGVKLFFPYSFATSFLYNPDAAPYFVNIFLWVIVPIIQYPLYGLLLSFAGEKGWLRRLAVGLAVAHIVLAMLNLLIPNERFS